MICDTCQGEGSLWIVGSIFCSLCALKYEMFSPEEEEFLMSEMNNAEEAG
jgi:hypothetical protein